MESKRLQSETECVGTMVEIPHAHYLYYMFVPFSGNFCIYIYRHFVYDYKYNVFCFCFSYEKFQSEH